MQANTSNFIFYLLRTVVVCVLLHHYSSKAATAKTTLQQLAVSEPDLQSLQLLLTEHRALGELTGTMPQARDRRQVSEPVNNACNDTQIAQVIGNLNDSCIDAISSVSLASPVYLSSAAAETDIGNLCRDDCAGELLRLDKMCPEYFPNFATYLQGVCSFNSRMNRCAFSVRENDGMKVFQKCFVETNAYEDRCRRRCKNALTAFDSDIGCCINSFYNDTWEFFGNLQRFQPHLNYSIDPFLWETCGIPYPSECSEELSPSPSPSPTPTPITNPPPSQPTNDPLCIEDKTSVGESCLSLLTEFQTAQGLQAIAEDSSKTSELCSAECGEQYVKQCTETSSNSYEILQLFCGQFSGERCGSLIAKSYSSLLQNLSACATTPESVIGSCSNECQSALVSTGSELGCCQSLLTLETVSQRLGIEVVDSRLWSRCGLELPQRCEDPFDRAVEETKETGSSKAWMVGVAVPVALLVLVAVALVSIVTIAIAKNRQRHNKGSKTSPEEANDADDMMFNHSYHRVTIPNQIQGNSYSTVTMKPRGFMESSESLFEILDSTPHVIPNPSHYDKVVGPPRVKKERGTGWNGEEGEGDEEEVEEEEGERGEGEDDKRGFEYTTTANIARHLRSERVGGSVDDGGPAYANLSTTLVAGAASSKTVIYQEPRRATHNSLHDEVVMKPGSPALSQQYNYIQSGLYHYPRTDTFHTATTISNTANAESSIETEVNVSYMAQSSPHPLPITSSPSSPSPTANPTYQKPVAKPRKNSSAGVATMNPPTTDDTSNLDYGGGVRMTRNVSYGVPYRTMVATSPYHHPPTITEHTADTAYIPTIH